MKIFRYFEEELRKYNAVARMISLDHLTDLKSEIESLNHDHKIGREVYRQYIRNYFDFSVTDKYPEAKSLIIIATPSYPVTAVFQNNGSSYVCIIPPTYTDKHIINKRIKSLTSKLFDANGYNTLPVVLPKKLIAVHSGLAKFGKNNVAYIDNMGSFHRLTLFASDLPCLDDSWYKLQMLDRCGKCKACLNSCPTQAIDRKKFIINADKCLTRFNEHVKPFPQWIDTSWQNSLIGCMRCQSVCPENKHIKLQSRETIEFSEYETRLILESAPYIELPNDLQGKLEKLCLEKYYLQICRNLNHLHQAN
ncbi:MAG: 4Fe-4S double cluster binding domain-containing protein [Calditrichaceae bacterium]